MTSDVNTEAVVTGARQTMASWSHVVESWEAVPAVYASSAQKVLKAGPPFPYTVFAPAFMGVRRMTTEKLVSEANDSLYVWERLRNQVVMTEYPLKAISDFEVGTILLYSWLTINGVTRAGIAASTTIEFNTATRRHFTPFVDKLRPAPEAVDEREQNAERAKFDYLAAESFKFMNYACESLVAGEQVIQSLWQPEIYKPLLRFGGYTLHRTLALAHLAILTNKELIVISDDARSTESRGVRYGGKWHYVGLSHIGTVSVHDRAEDLMALCLTLTPGGRPLEIVFAASKKREMAQLQAALEKIKR